jgi:hypothetical protein
MNLLALVLVSVGVLAQSACSDSTVVHPVDSGMNAEAGVDGNVLSTACATGQFRYDDQLCGYDQDASYVCNQAGDGKCYDTCTSSADCNDPARPYCSMLGLFSGANWNCHSTVSVARVAMAGSLTGIRVTAYGAR